MPHDFFHGRHAGLLIPLFSLPSRDSWGIGEIGDLPRLGAWLAEAGFSFVQLLPINEMADGQNSPYSAMSAMAIDPIFISPSAVPDVESLRRGRRCCRRPSARCSRRRAQSSRDRLHGGPHRQDVRAARRRSIISASDEWQRDTNRARRLKAFIDGARWWIDDYALFRALHARARGRAWMDWDAPIRDREPAALEAARQELGDRDPVPLLPAVARRQPVAAGARRVRHRRVRRFPVHGRRRQRRRLVAAAGLPPRCLGRRAPGRLLRDGAGLGLPGLPLERDRPRRLRMARRARQAQRRALRRLPGRSSRRVLPHLRPRGQRESVVRAAGRAPPDASRARRCSTS